MHSKSNLEHTSGAQFNWNIICSMTFSSWDASQNKVLLRENARGTAGGKGVGVVYPCPSPGWGEGEGGTPVQRPDWGTPSSSSPVRIRTGVPPHPSQDQGRGIPFPQEGPGIRDKGTTQERTGDQRSVTSDLGCPLPPCWQTHTCENSTFPILRMRAVTRYNPFHRQTFQLNSVCWNVLMILFSHCANIRKCLNLRTPHQDVLCQKVGEV